MVQKVSVIWKDGSLVPWDEANVHILTHTIHYGLGVFEGIRCYKTSRGPAVFHLPAHVHRLCDSAKAVGIPTSFSEEQIRAAVKDTIRANGLTECYIRPLIILGEGAMGLFPANNPPSTYVIVWEWGAYLGEEGLAKGIRVQVSSFTRHHVNVSLTKAKVCGQYVNSILAKTEAIRNGYQEALLLDPQGYVAEGTGENIFIVVDGRLYTPPLTSILAGITRSSVMTLAGDLGYEVREALLTRDMVYCADEAFLTGTAAEITPIREVDGRTIGAGGRGPVTRAIQESFFASVRGENRKHPDWPDPVE